MFERITVTAFVLAAFALCPASLVCTTRGALAAPARTTNVTFVQNDRTSLVEVPTDALLQVKADTSQNGPTPTTTTFKGHVTLTVQRKQGPLTLTGNQVTAESALIELQVAPISDPVIDGGSDIKSLDLALNAFPSVAAFRITWSFSGLGASVRATEVYRRSAQTLALYSDFTDEIGHTTTRKFYTKVTQDVIHAFSTQDPAGEPKYLTDLGAVYDIHKSYELRTPWKK